MIDGKDGCAYNNKGDPYGYIDHIQILKTKLTDSRTKNTEQGTMGWIEWPQNN